MQNLPAGWRVSNSSGSWAAPAHKLDEDDEAEFSGDEEFGAEDIRPDSPGWEDVEADVEEVTIKCLLCEDKFPAARAMVDHGKEQHNFDLDPVRKSNNLDFLNTVKLVNYIRTSVASGTAKPDVSKADLWADDKYLQPALADDALLYSIDEMANPNDPDDPLVEKEEEAASEKEGAGHKALAERAVR